MTYSQGISAKQEALQALGPLLPSYSALQQEYSSRVHLPDYRAFSKEWEASLYHPIRQAAQSAINPRQGIDRGSLLYCAPGSHAPLLRDGVVSSTVFDQVTLLDIDPAALKSAEQNVRAAADDTEVEAVAFDFSGPFGQRLCDAYLEALHHGNAPSAVATKLNGFSLLDPWILFDEELVLDHLCAQLDSASGGRRWTMTVSEMVASFSGTAVWLAFRSALYQRFAKSAERGDLAECLDAATILWQRYNQCFLGFHLKFLRRQMAPSGSLLLVFDTRKVYDDPEVEALHAFPPDVSLDRILEGLEFRIVRHEILSWRDHPCGFEMSICGIEVSDFQPHAHDVKLYVLEAAS